MSRTIVVSSILTFLSLSLTAAHAQEPPAVDVPDDIAGVIQQMQFDVPTRIGGRLLTFDAYDDAIWIEWTEVYSGRRWVFVPPEMRFIVYPRDSEMMDFFRRLKPGALLRMTIQIDKHGKRRVLELEGT